MNTHELSINRCFGFYLMASYLYYIHDESMLLDEEYDAICKRLYKEWKNITHVHKKIVKKTYLQTGSGFSIKEHEYPLITRSTAHWIYKNKIIQQVG